MSEYIMTFSKSIGMNFQNKKSVLALANTLKLNIHAV